MYFTDRNLWWSLKSTSNVNVYALVILICTSYQEVKNMWVTGFLWWNLICKLQVVLKKYEFALVHASDSTCAWCLNSTSATYMCVSGGKKCQFFRKFCVSAKWMIPWFCDDSKYVNNRQKIAGKKSYQCQWFHSISPPLPLFAGGDNFQSKILKWRGSEKNECLRGRKEFLPWILACGAYCFLSKKTSKN